MLIKKSLSTSTCSCVLKSLDVLVVCHLAQINFVPRAFPLKGKALVKGKALGTKLRPNDSTVQLSEYLYYNWELNIKKQISPSNIRHHCYAFSIFLLLYFIIAIGAAIAIVVVTITII